jgi:hypothetical protein
MDAGRSRPRERFLCPEPQDAVFGDQRPVEVEREGGDPPRESWREGERYGVPPVDFTT